MELAVYDQLKFEDHMHEKNEGANNKMALISRSFIHLNVESSLFNL